MKKLLVLCIVAGSMFAQQKSYDYENMEKEQYVAELQRWKDKNSNAEARIAQLDKELSAEDGLMTAENAREKEARAKLLATVGKDEASFTAYTGNLEALRSDAQTFLAQSPEEAYKNRRDIDALEKRLADLKNDSAAHTAEGKALVAQIENMIAQAREKSTLPNTMYEVQKGDYLWKIAKKDDVYGDAYAWVRIYNANKNLIKDPNMIFPKQVFTVPRSVDANQYLVNRGDNLFKIAKSFGNAFTWVQLHKANSDNVEDANMIMPYQVLTVPNN